MEENKNMKRCFIYETEPWKRPVLVVVGGGLDDIITASDVFGKTQKVIEDVRSDPPTTGDEACHWHKDGETVLWFEDWDTYFKGGVVTLHLADLYRLSLVVHETNHVLFDLSRYVGFTDEPEANAYTQQYLWLEIVTRLSTP